MQAEKRQQFQIAWFWANGHHWNKTFNSQAGQNAELIHSGWKALHPQNLQQKRSNQL